MKYIVLEGHPSFGGQRIARSVLIERNQEVWCRPQRVLREEDKGFLALVSAGVNPLLFAGEDAVFGEGQSRSGACKDEATMAP